VHFIPSPALKCTSLYRLAVGEGVLVINEERECCEPAIVTGAQDDADGKYAVRCWDGRECRAVVACVVGVEYGNFASQLLLYHSSLQLTASREEGGDDDDTPRATQHSAAAAVTPSREEENDKPRGAGHSAAAATSHKPATATRGVPLPSVVGTSTVVGPSSTTPTGALHQPVVAAAAHSMTSTSSDRKERARPPLPAIRNAGVGDDDEIEEEVQEHSEEDEVDARAPAAARAAAPTRVPNAAPAAAPTVPTVGAPARVPAAPSSAAPSGGPSATTATGRHMGHVEDTREESEESDPESNDRGTPDAESNDRGTSDAESDAGSDAIEFKAAISSATSLADLEPLRGAIKTAVLSGHVNKKDLDDLRRLFVEREAALRGDVTSEEETATEAETETEAEEVEDQSSQAGDETDESDLVL
jgi:hypothetical protein